MVGIDISPYAIGLALDRTGHKRERLAFRVGDINHVHQVLPDYPDIDTVIAMEVLYAAHMLAETIMQFAGFLPEHGQMLFIANQHIHSRETEAHKLLPDQTDLSAAIKKHCFALKVFDITQNKVSYLERSIALLEQYKTAFEQEGNRDFWAARILYDRNMLKRVQEGLTKRFLYYVSKGMKRNSYRLSRNKPYSHSPGLLPNATR
jgi:hypothetical protein